MVNYLTEEYAKVRLTIKKINRCHFETIRDKAKDKFKVRKKKHMCKICTKKGV